MRSGVIFMVQNAGGFSVPPHRQRDIFYVRRRSSRNPTLPAHIFNAPAEAPRYSALFNAGLSFSTPLFQYACISSFVGVFNGRTMRKPRNCASV